MKNAKLHRLSYHQPGLIFVVLLVLLSAMLVMANIIDAQISTFKVDPIAVGPEGGTLTISIVGVPNTEINILFDNTKVEELTETVGPEGVFNRSLEIAANLNPGIHTIIAQDSNSNNISSVKITKMSQSTTSTKPSISTSADTKPNTPVSTSHADTSIAPASSPANSQSASTIAKQKTPTPTPLSDISASLVGSSVPSQIANNQNGDLGFYIYPTEGGLDGSIINLSGSVLFDQTLQSTLEFDGNPIQKIIDKNKQPYIKVPPNTEPGNHIIVLKQGETVYFDIYRGEKSFASSLVGFVPPGIIGLLLGGIIIIILLRWTGRLSGNQYAPVPEDAGSLTTRLDIGRIRQENQNLNEKLTQYRSNEQRIPQLKQTYLNKTQEIKAKMSGPQAGFFAELEKSPPTEDYSAYGERIRSLDVLATYISLETEKARIRRKESLDLVESLKREDPALFSIIEKVVASANADEMPAVNALLRRVLSDREAKPISSNLNDELTKWEKSIENIRDYSFRLVPMKIIKLSRDLIASPASEKENAIKEKTVRELIKLIDEYLRL
jgi:hypothetical protein